MWIFICQRLGNQEVTNKCLERYILQRLNEKQIERLKRPITDRNWRSNKTPPDLFYSKRRQWDYMNQGWWLTPRNQHLVHTAGQIHIWTHWDCDSTCKTCTSSNQSKPQHGEGETQSPIPCQGSTCNWYLLGKKKKSIFQ